MWDLMFSRRSVRRQPFSELKTAPKIGLSARFKFRLFGSTVTHRNWKLPLQYTDPAFIFYEEERWQMRKTPSTRIGTSKDAKYSIHIVKKLSGPYGGLTQNRKKRHLHLPTVKHHKRSQLFTNLKSCDNFLFYYSVFVLYITTQPSPAVPFALTSGPSQLRQSDLPWGLNWSPGRGRGGVLLTDKLSKWTALGQFEASFQIQLTLFRIWMAQRKILIINTASLRHLFVDPSIT